MRSISFAIAVALLVGCRKEEPKSGTIATSAIKVDPAHLIVPAGVQPPRRTAAAEEPKAEPKATTDSLLVAAAAPLTGKEYEDRTKQLLEAAEKGRLSLIMDLLKKGCDVNDKDDDGQTALHKAASKGHKSVALSLLVLGADMNERDLKGRTPVMVAAEAGNAEVLNLLLTPDAVKNGAAEALGAAMKEFKFNPDGLRSRLGTASSAANDVVDKTGQTAVMLAALGGHSDCLHAILSGSDYQRNRERCLRADKKGRNAIMHAAAGGHADALDKILTSWYTTELTLADLRAVDEEGKSALEIAEAGMHKGAVRRLWIEIGKKSAKYGDLATVKTAMEKYPGDLTAQQMLYVGAAGGRVEVVNHFLGIWKDKSAEEKLTLLTNSPREGSILHGAVASGNAPTVKALTDSEWWKDKAMLASFIRYKFTSGNSAVDPVLESTWLRNNHLEMVKLVEARLKEVETVQKK